MSTRCTMRKGRAPAGQPHNFGMVYANGMNNLLHNILFNNNHSRNRKCAAHPLGVGSSIGCPWYKLKSKAGAPSPNFSWTNRRTQLSNFNKQTWPKHFWRETIDLKASIEGKPWSTKSIHDGRHGAEGRIFGVAGTSDIAYVHPLISRDGWHSELFIRWFQAHDCLVCNLRDQLALK